MAERKGHQVGESLLPRIVVQKTTHEILQNLKIELKAKSLNDVIMDLVSSYRGKVAPVAPDRPEQEAIGGQEKKRKVRARPALFSLEILREREGMLHFYTGMELGTVTLIVEELKVSRQQGVFFFVFFSALPMARL
jgi:hypothetical protein